MPWTKVLYELASSSDDFSDLMPFRIKEILLVATRYDSFVLEEDGGLDRRLFDEFAALKLYWAPRIRQAASPDEAFRILESQQIDMVITMPRLAGSDVPTFARGVKEAYPDLPLVMLSYDAKGSVAGEGLYEHMDRVFEWSGNSSILLAAIKSIEDERNVAHDTKLGMVRVIVVIEDNPRYLSMFLPLIYTEVVSQTRALIDEDLNDRDRLMRMRARPKILIAHTYEQATELIDRYGHYLIGVISDINFPRAGDQYRRSGIELIADLRPRYPDLPIALHSMNTSYAPDAESLGAVFLHKLSPRFLLGLRRFFKMQMGFGPFIFRDPLSMEAVGEADDMRGLERTLAQVPVVSILFHGKHNHFSAWLMARGQLRLAARIQAVQVTDFRDGEELRQYLIDALAAARRFRYAASIEEFSPQTYAGESQIVRLYGGSFGGKGRGLAFVHNLLARTPELNHVEAVIVSVPRAALIGTDAYDEFIALNGLTIDFRTDASDAEITEAYLAASLPPFLTEALRVYLKFNSVPLAVRSSSLLEDNYLQPFAGIYSTFMLPNDASSDEQRLAHLERAIKLVYASGSREGARSYLAQTGHSIEEEKMGIVLQAVAGRRHDNVYYPTFSGAAQSTNFYPFGPIKPEDGAAALALGLAHTVVNGESALRFSPAHPQIVPQLASPKDALRASQRQFYALRLDGLESPPLTADEGSTLVALDIAIAEEHGELAAVASAYDPDDDRVRDDLSHPGPRLLTFAHVRRGVTLPLCKIVMRLLDSCADAMGCPVEIEFAVVQGRGTEPTRFHVLQARPIVVSNEQVEVSLAGVPELACIARTTHALGNGRYTDIQDVVFSRRDTFNAAHTQEMVAEVAALNHALQEEGRRYVLIGPGRWGSRDPWLGIPVRWADIAGACVIIEADVASLIVDASQGSHFFQNLVALRVGYMKISLARKRHETTIRSESNVTTRLSATRLMPAEPGSPGTAGGPPAATAHLDWDWLESRPVHAETAHFRHVRLTQPLECRIDGRTTSAALIRPEMMPADEPPAEPN